MRRFLAPLVLLLFCAGTAFGFNSNMPGGTLAGGSCTGGQFMSGISSAGVPICTTPSGGAPFPPGSPPQIGGFSALNTGEAQTVIGDFTFARTGTAQLTATVTRLNGIVPGGTCTGSQFVNVISASGVPTCAALPAPAAGSISDAMLANAYSGIGACAAGSVATTLNRNAAPTCTAIGTVGSGVFAPLTNPAGGQNGYASTSNPTFTGTVTLPAASITDANLANAYSGIGACTGGQFVSTLNRNAAPTCTAPATQFTAGGDLSGTATSQNVIGIRSTSVPILASGYLHYTGTAFVWDTPATGSFAPTTNPAGGQNNYAPLAAPSFTGAATMATLNLTGTAPSLTFGGVAMGGACGTGAFVSSISNTGVPTCGSNLGTIYAPLANAAGGANNYAPISSPTLNGTTTVTNLTGSTIGTWTPPDGSSWTLNGESNMKALSVGAALPGNLAQVGGGLVVGPGGIYNIGSSPAALNLFAGLYPTSGGFQVTSSGGIFDVVENGNTHEMSFFIGNNQTVGSNWSGARTQYLALRDPNVSGGIPGLFLETGAIQAVNGSIVAGQPTGGVLGSGLFNGTGYDVNGSPIAASNLADTVPPTNFTPTLQFATTTAGIVYTFPGGNYYKVGKLVHVIATMAVSSVGTSTGQGKICNLPYASLTGFNQGNFYCANFAGLPTSSAPIFGQIGGNTTCITMYVQPTNGGNPIALDQTYNWGNLQCTFDYVTN